MEFLRFGSSIPGSYWGCCACCIIQNFKVDPDAKASIQLVGGDGGNPVMQGNEMLFAGPTYRDIFWQRIRFGTFDKRDMPNHAFLAILTENQIKGAIGKKWLEILREAGFEFVRTVCNSVYAGQAMLTGEPTNQSRNYIFGLFRNIGAGAVKDPFTPPPEWTDLPSVVPELWQEAHLEPEASVALAKKQREAQRVIWDKIGPPKLMTEKQLVEAGVPITLAGLRSEFPQEPKATREQKKAAKEKAQPAKGAALDPFAPQVAVAAPVAG